MVQPPRSPLKTSSQSTSSQHQKQQEWSGQRSISPQKRQPSFPVRPVEIWPKVDYSFKNLVYIEDVFNVEPSAGSRKRIKKQQQQTKKQEDSDDDERTMNGLRIVRGAKNIAARKKEEQKAAALERQEHGGNGAAQKPASSDDDEFDDWFDYDDDSDDGLDPSEENVDQTGAATAATSKQRAKAVVPVQEQEREWTRFMGNSIKLSNNNLIRISSRFREVIFSTMEYPLELTHIDLSYNCLQDLRELSESMAFLENTLESLQLHANQISDSDQIAYLHRFKKLKQLTLFGNPVDQIKNYRFHVLMILPWLRTFDRTTVTKRDLDSADTYRRIIVEPKIRQKQQKKHH